jgi:CheY-like chemotaxis protein
LSNPRFLCTFKVIDEATQFSSLRWPNRESHFLLAAISSSPERPGTAASSAWTPVMEVSMAKSVLIADDNEVIRRMLCVLFDSQSDFEVCGAAENGQEAVEMAQLLHPDLIMLDLSMPVMNGIEAACALKRLMPMTPLIVFSEFSDVFSQREARATVVATLVSKSESLSVLLEKARAAFHPRLLDQLTSGRDEMGHG